MPSDDPAASAPTPRRTPAQARLPVSAPPVYGAGPDARPCPDPGAGLRIALTTGEPAGIGPDITVSALLAHAGALRDARCRVSVLADPDLLARRAAMTGVLQPWQRLLAAPDSPVSVLPLALDAPCTAGTLDARNGAYVLRLLDAAIDGCLRGEFDAMVTAPLQKSTINEACADTGTRFTGHTEYLAERTGTPRVVMMLAGPQQTRGGEWLRVALATTHLPLAAVPGAITGPLLAEVLQIIDHDLRGHFGIAAPRILVTGLNPHAGEGGHMGREEIEVIGPALERARAAGIDARGPYPADTLFQPRHLQHADCVLAMYHDQGLAPLKYATFGEGVNVTLGLPLIRTSVDHGTALDLAGTGRAGNGSLLQALEVAMQMAQARAAQS